MSSPSYIRQEGLFNPADHRGARVSFIGLGGIGSFAAIATAKLGIPHITIMDPDEAEDHNVPNQFYGMNDIGQYKTEATRYYIQQYGGQQADTCYGKITEQGYVPNLDDSDPWNPSGLVISGVDSMASRKDIWEHGKIKYNPSVKLYLDARIGGSHIIIYAVDPTNPGEIESYEKTLHSDDEAEATACTERGIIDVGFQVGAQLVRKIRQHYSGDDVAQVTTFDQNTLTSAEGDYLL